jgi:hypothetical protein
MCLAAAAGVAACGGGGGGDGSTSPPASTFPSPPPGEFRSVVGVQVPPGFPLQASQMTLFAGTQSAQMQANGQGLANLPSGIPVIVGAGASGQPSMLGLNTGGSATQTLSAQSTAQALAFLSPALATRNTAQATQIASAITASPAFNALTAAVQARLVASPAQAITVADPGIATALGTLVSNVLSTTPSPRFQQPARPLPTSETPTNRGGVQLTVLPTRDAQGRLQVSLDNGQPRWLSVVRSYSDDGVTWTTPSDENGTFGVMLGAGTASGPSIQPPTATIPLSSAPFVRVTTYGLGNDLATALADPNAQYIRAAATAQWIATAAVPALEPALATGSLQSGLNWGTGQTGTLQSWSQAALPCTEDPVVAQALQQSTQTGSLDAAFKPFYSCTMRAGATAPGVVTGLLTAAGLAGRTTPPELPGMFNVLSTLGTGVDAAYNVQAIRAVRAINTFEVPDSTRFIAVTGVTPNSGPISGGTPITITGANFPATGLAVRVGGTLASSIVRVSATQITATTPSRGTSGAVSVEVSAAGYRTGTCSGCYTYQAPQPITVTRVTEPFGPVTGGASVFITGTNFTTVSAVTFGGRPATNVQVVSSTRINATVPAGAAIGAVNVVVTPTSGTAATCTNCFIYFTPTIGISPESGPVSGGTQVTVTDIPAASLITGVDIGTNPATGLAVLSPTSIRFTTPAGTATGAVAVNFRYAVGVLGCPGCFQYTAAPPPTQTGRFEGRVVNAVTQAPIAGVSVSIRNAGTSTQVGTATSGADGTYQSGPLPAGRYDLHHSATGFSNSPLFDQELVGGAGTPTTNLPTVQMIPTSATSGTITGAVRNAVTNATISGATVELRAGAGSTTGTPIATATTNASGSYTFATQPAGTYTVRATATGFTPSFVVVSVLQATNTAGPIFLSPSSGSVPVWRVVLSWGATPQDLDAYLSGPLAGSSNRFLVGYFGEDGSLESSPFARLDVDVTTGFGPETITIQQQIAGVYRYFVHNYTGRFGGSPFLRNSNARVDLYRGTTLVRQFNVPQQDGFWWTVFELNGETITTINTIGNTQPQEPLPAGPYVRAWTLADELRLLESRMVPKVGGAFRR